MLLLHDDYADAVGLILIYIAGDESVESAITWVLVVDVDSYSDCCFVRAAAAETVDSDNGYMIATVAEARDESVESAITSVLVVDVHSYSGCCYMKAAAAETVDSDNGYMIATVAEAEVEAAECAIIMVHCYLVDTDVDCGSCYMMAAALAVAAAAAGVEYILAFDLLTTVNIGGGYMMNFDDCSCSCMVEWNSYRHHALVVAEPLVAEPLVVAIVDAFDL